MKRCNKCILPESFPGISYDENGLCNFCQAEIDSSVNGLPDQVKIKVEEYLTKIKGENQYDAIVCYSGGKDSTYTLRLCVEKYKLNILAFTFDNGFLSELARKNIENVVSYLDVDHLYFRPKMKIFKNLVRVINQHDVYPESSKLRVSPTCQACINMINLKTVELALEKNISTVIAGFTLGQIPQNAILYEYKYNTIQKFRAGENEQIISLLSPEVSEYLYLSEKYKEIKKFPFYLNLRALEDIEEENIIKSIADLGWTVPLDVDGCSSNCRLNTFANIMFLCKRGFHPYESELSYLIRKNRLKRDQALEKISVAGNLPEYRRLALTLGFSEKEIEAQIQIIEDGDYYGKK